MFQDLPTDKLTIRDDARALNPATVAALAESIAEIGLINPVRVRPSSDGWEVIAGVHRLQAHKKLGLVEITCDVVESEADEASLAMIDENVIREELSPAELARQMATKKAIYQRRYPDNRTQRDVPADERPERFTLKVAKATGQSEATVQQQVSRGEKVIGEVLDLVKGTPFDKATYLDTLKAMPPNDQLAAAKRDLAHWRTGQRDKMATVRRNKVQGDVKARAAKEVAEMIAEHVPGEWWDAIKSNLYAAGAANIAHELTNITGQSIIAA